MFRVFKSNCWICFENKKYSVLTNHVSISSSDITVQMANSLKQYYFFFFFWKKAFRFGQITGIINVHTELMFEAFA